MKSARNICEFPSGKTLLAVLGVFFILCVGPANAASEPGTVTIVLEAEPISIDVGESTRAVEGQVLMENIFENLTSINPHDSSIMPRLATSWKQTDANTWQFSLRRGVKFHDGADFNAEAVVFNIGRMYDKNIAGNTRQKYFGDIRMTGKALDSYTVEIKLEKPEPLLPSLMGLMSICSPNTPMKVTRSPIGTGPYKFVKWDAGLQIIFERFDGYWGKQPQVKKAVYVWRKESAVRAAMVEIGEADLTPSIAVQDATRPDMDFSYFNSETSVFRIGGDFLPPLTDRRVRLAMNLAVDRDAIRGSIFSKDVVPATQIIVPNIFGYNPDLKPWPYDPKKAKQLLDEARKDGVPVDKEILLVGRYGIYPGDQEVTEALMTMFKAVGLNAKIKMVESGQYRSYHFKPFPKDLLYLVQKQHNNSYGDAAFSVFNQYHCKGNQSQICDKSLDDQIEKATVSTGEERRKLWQAIFKRLHEEIIPNVELFHMVGFARIGKRVNFKPSLATVSALPLEQVTFK
jgi:peptide/nickel transport system substrate-binding protein